MCLPIEDVEAVKLTHKGKIVGLNFSSDSKFLISSSWDGTAMVWDMARAAEGKASPVRLDGHEYSVMRRSQKMANLSILPDMMATSAIGVFQTKHFCVRSSEMAGIVNVMYVDETDGLIAYGTTDSAMVIHDLYAG